MTNRVNMSDFTPDEPFKDLGINHGQYHTTRFCIKCHWNPNWGNHGECDGEVIIVPVSIRFPKKKSSKRTWKVFTLFLKRLPQLTEEEEINADRLKKLNQILYGGKKWRKNNL